MLDGPSDELRRDALDTICALAVALGQDFNIFVPTIDKVCNFGFRVDLGCRIRVYIHTPGQNFTLSLLPTHKV